MLLKYESHLHSVKKQDHFGKCKQLCDDSCFLPSDYREGT